MSDDQPTKQLGSFQKKKAEKEMYIKKNHLLVIGIDNYEGIYTNLNNPVKDCQDLIEVLTNKYQFETNSISTLFNEEATRGNIYDKLESYMDELTDQDNLLIYFSGHGEYNESMDLGFWIPSNAKRNSDFISNSDVKNNVKGIKAHHVILIVDSCFSGSLAKGNKSANIAADRLERRQSRWILTSGRVELVSDGKKEENSPFAKSLLYELAHNEKGKLRLSELGTIVTNVVANNAKQTPYCQRMEGVNDMGGEFSFTLKGYVPNEKEKETPDDIIPKSPSPQPITPPPVIQKDISPIKSQLKQDIASGKTKRVIKELENLMNPDSERYNDLLGMSARFKKLNKDILRGIISNSEANVGKNRIVVGLLDFIDELEGEDLK